MPVGWPDWDVEKRAAQVHNTEDLGPMNLPCEVFKERRGWASTWVLAFKARKSEQGLAPPPGLLTRCKAELQSVLVSPLTFSMTPSLIIWSHASLPAAALAESMMMGRLFVRHGGWLPVSILWYTPWSGSPFLKLGFISCG